MGEVPVADADRALDGMLPNDRMAQVFGVGDLDLDRLDDLVLGAPCHPRVGDGTVGAWFVVPGQGW